MSLYDFNPESVSVSFDILPKDEYEFEIGTPKPFSRQAGEDKHDSFGVRFPMKAVAPAGLEDKKVTPYSIYMQSSGGQSFAKQFMMAVYGYGKGPVEEKRFNEDFKSKDWKFDPEDGFVGEVYAQAEGRHVIASLDVGLAQDGETEQQQWTGFRSIESGAITR